MNSYWYATPHSMRITVTVVPNQPFGTHNISLRIADNPLWRCVWTKHASIPFIMNTHPLPNWHRNQNVEGSIGWRTHQLNELFGQHNWTRNVVQCDCFNGRWFEAYAILTLMINVFYLTVRIDHVNVVWCTIDERHVVNELHFFSNHGL